MPTGVYERKPLSEEHKQKISKANKGNIGYWAGKHLSEETKIKISKTLTGRKFSPRSDEVKRKIGEANRGRIFSEEHKEKLSKAHIGKKQSLETIEKRIRKGKKHYNWQGGKSFEKYTIQFNKELKELIRQRDGYQCQMCGMPECENMRKLHTHHIDYDKKNCLPSNLISLCTSCHMKTNYNRKYWMEYFKLKGF